MLISVICARIKICRRNEAISYGYVRTREIKFMKKSYCFTEQEKKKKKKNKTESEISILVTEMSPTSPFCTLPLIKLFLF